MSHTIGASGVSTGPVFNAIIAVRKALGALQHLSDKTTLSLEDLAMQVLQIDESAASHLDLLWRHCAETENNATIEQFSLAGKRFGQALVALYVNCTRQMECGTPVTCICNPLLLIRAMHALRTLFKWCWIRYEIPAELSWKAAFEIKQYAERTSQHRMLRQLYPHATYTSSVD